MKIGAWRSLLALLVPLTLAEAQTPTAGETTEGRQIQSETPGSGETRTALADRLDQIRRLLTQIEVLQTQLANQAQAALERADAAQDLDERLRQERLYTEIGLRIGQLQGTHRDLGVQLKALEERLGPSGP